jgi:hypothetical protein
MKRLILDGNRIFDSGIELDQIKESLRESVNVTGNIEKGYNNQSRRSLDPLLN